MRRQFIVNARFQYRYAFSFVRGILLAIFAPAAVIFLTVFLIANDPIVAVDQRQILMNGLNHLIILFLWAALILSLCFAVMGAYLSYKYIGPLKRLEAWLENRMLRHEKGMLKLRTGDDLIPIAQVLNRILNKGL